MRNSFNKIINSEAEEKLDGTEHWLIIFHV